MARLTYPKNPNSAPRRRLLSIDVFSTNRSDAQTNHRRDNSSESSESYMTSRASDFSAQQRVVRDSESSEPGMFVNSPKDISRISRSSSTNTTPKGFCFNENT